MLDRAIKRSIRTALKVRHDSDIARLPNFATGVQLAARTFTG